VCLFGIIIIFYLLNANNAVHVERRHENRVHVGPSRLRHILLLLLFLLAVIIYYTVNAASYVPVCVRREVNFENRFGVYLNTAD
jgi:hypothetical protein